MSGDVVCVATQAELDRATKNGDIACCCKGGHFTASGSASVTASDSASVTASDSASVRASGSASVTASGSASVTASGSASVRAYDSASVRASGSASVTATKFVATHDHGPRTKVNGGVIITVPRPATAEEWCEYHGVEVADGIATLFKAVRNDYRSARGADYSPGNTPEAADWDGGKRECGGGLHFGARTWEAKAFDYAATRYVACPVRLDEIAVHPDGAYPNKVKARRVVAPGCWECDEFGKGLPVAVEG